MLLLNGTSVKTGRRIITSQLEIDAKYAVYLDRQAADVVRMLPGPPTISELAAEFSAA